MEITNTQNMTSKQFGKEEIGELTEIRTTYEQLTNMLGQIEIQRREIEKNRKQVENQLTVAEGKEKAFLDKIIAKYGEGTFDIATGAFTPKKK
jgi:uncharacterized protein with von Willebrand factor type A (vWA) domain